MMTVVMNNLPAPSRERVRSLYLKNMELEKPHKSSQARAVPSDPNAWHQMRDNYEAIFLEDSAFSEQYEIEYALWQLHYKRIEEYRAHFSSALVAAGSAQPGWKGPPRLDRIKKIRIQLKMFLSEATGFYHELILKIRSKYGLPLGDYSEDPQKLNTIEKDEKISEVKKGLMSCHRCLIYLGDLARYKGLYGESGSKTREYAAASSYYMQAVSLWPSSGNPHHQLAILASYSGDDLCTIYRYYRSLAVDNPFKTAIDNLIVAFEKNQQCYSQLPGDPKLSTLNTVKGRGQVETTLPLEDIKGDATSTKENHSSIPETYKSFCIRFVRLNGILFTETSLETFDEVLSLLIRDLNELLFSGPEEQLNFGTQSVENELVVVRLVAILIFTVHIVNREVVAQSYAEILQRSVLRQNAFIFAFELMGHILERCIQLRDPSSSYLLPGILVFIEWLSNFEEFVSGNDLKEREATARFFFWKHCTLLLNKLMSSNFISVAEDADDTFFNMSRSDEGYTDNILALWEDFELRGFFPLYRAQFLLNFSRNLLTGSDMSAREKRVRVHRLLVAGRGFACNPRIDDEPLYFDKGEEIGVTPDQKDDSSEDGMSPEFSEIDIAEHGQTDDFKSNRMLPEFPEIDVAELVGEEGEEIVYKPMISEKLADMPVPKLSAYDGTGYCPTTTHSEWKSYAGSTSAPFSNFSLKNGFDANNKPPLTFFGMPCQNQQPFISGVSNWPADQQAYLVNGADNKPPASFGMPSQDQQPFISGLSNWPADQQTYLVNGANEKPPYTSFGMPSQNLQPVFSGASNWLAEQEAYLINGVNNLNIAGNDFVADGFVTNAELKGGSGSSQLHVIRPPFSKSVNLTGNNVYTNQILAAEAVIPFKSDSVMSSGLNADSKPFNPSSAFQAGMKKNPVSRPVRHFGPPPGFSSVPPKQVDEVKVGAKSRDDDYCGLDAYSALKSITRNNSTSHTPYLYPYVTNDNNSLTGMLNFSFPGKQGQPIQVQDETQKIWQDHQLMEQLKIYKEQLQQHQQQQQHQHQHQQVNQPCTRFPEQYQGQSLWSGPVFV